MLFSEFLHHDWQLRSRLWLYLLVQDISCRAWVILASFLYITGEIDKCHPSYRVCLTGLSLIVIVKARIIWIHYLDCDCDKLFLHYSCMKIVITSTGFTLHGKYMRSGQNDSQSNGITGDKSEHAFQAILSTLSRNEMGFCMRNIVVRKHKASLCSTASSSENSGQTEDQLQRWKWGLKGVFFSPPPPKIKLLLWLLLLSPPFLIPNWGQTELWKWRDNDVKEELCLPIFGQDGPCCLN